MCQSPTLTSINLSEARGFLPPLLCSYLTQANLLSPLPRHRSINLFLLAYQRIWIETEEYSFEEKLVQDLAVSTYVVPSVPSCRCPCTVGGLCFSPTALLYSCHCLNCLKAPHSHPLGRPRTLTARCPFLESMTLPLMSEPVLYCSVVGQHPTEVREHPVMMLGLTNEIYESCGVFLKFSQS